MSSALFKERIHLPNILQKTFVNRSDFFSKFSVTSVHLHQSLSESSLVLALTSSCVVDEVPDFELTAYKCEGTLSSRSRRRRPWWSATILRKASFRRWICRARGFGHLSDVYHDPSFQRVV